MGEQVGAGAAEAVGLVSAVTVAAIGALIDANRELVPVLEESLADNDGEVLPHLVMADVMRFLVSQRGSNVAVIRSVLDWMEVAYQRGPDEVRGVIEASGVLMIPDPGEPGSEMRERLGVNLRRVDPWSDRPNGSRSCGGRD